MGTVMNGNKWSGVYVNGKEVSGLVKNGNVFYRSIKPGFIVEYTDPDGVFHSKYYEDYYGMSLSLTLNKSLEKVKVISRNIDVDGDIDYLFSSIPNMTYLDLSEFDTKAATSMTATFFDCKKLININLENFNTSNVTNFSAMFQSCLSLPTLDLSGFDTSKVTNFNGMFFNCTKLEEIDLSSFDTSSATTTQEMLWGCPKLVKVIINRNEVFMMTNVNMLQVTPIESGTGYVYVPDNMVEAYKSTTNWSAYADQIKPLSELEGYNG